MKEIDFFEWIGLLMAIAVTYLVLLFIENTYDAMDKDRANKAILRKSGMETCKTIEDEAWRTRCLTDVMRPMGDK